MFIAEETFNRFDDSGYVVLDFIEPEALDEIYKLYEETEHLVDLDTNFYTTIWSENMAYKKEINDKLKQHLSPFLDKHLQNYKVAFANFMVKKSGYSSSLQPHQDWTFVKEPDFYSITVWIPLKDVTEENGALEVLPGSNKLDNYIRARFMDSPFSEHNEYIAENLMKSIPLNRGEALLVNSRTIHASPNNMSGEVRVAASIVVYPKKTPLVHFVMNEEDKNLIEELSIDSDFFVKYNCFEKPKNEKVVSTRHAIQIPVELKHLKSL